VPTDLDGDQWQRFEHLVAPALKGSEFGTVRENLAASIPDVDFDDEVAPVLGETLVVASLGPSNNPHVLGVLETHDADRAKALADSVPNGLAIADGDTLLFQLSGGNHELDAAVDRHDAGSGMDAGTFRERFGDGADDDALVRVVADDPLPGVQTAALSFRLDSDAVVFHLRARTDDPARLARFLESLGDRGVHEIPGDGASIGLVGDGFAFEDSDGRQSVKLAPLGDPSADVRTSGDVVEAEVKTPLR